MYARIPTLLLVVLCMTAAYAAPTSSAPPDIDSYIRKAWTTLRRSVKSCDAYHDVKVGSRPTLYLPYGVPPPPDIVHLSNDCQVVIAHLPRSIRHLGDVQPQELQAQGLLYLPHPYVVPGGMFNEMYGWDSYFIVRGLIADGRVNDARDMVENWFYEIEQYGAILNANRTYYLTRSQPPFITSAVLAIFDQTHDRRWLSRAYEFAVKDHAMWTTAPNLAGDTGLSRYYDVGEGPIPEMGAHEHYYDQVAAKVALTPDYYKGDRAMRASGFDVSFRFGPYSARTHHFAPVCLNSLLYKEEMDLAAMARRLHRDADARKWKAAAARRAAIMREYLWNAQAGMFFDYDFTKRRLSDYHYATTFYPLWAGLASAEEAKRLVAHLGVFEQPHGLSMSDVRSGAQWDLPFGWAPVHLLTVEGLLRYGYREAALRIARKFNDMVLQNYLRDRTIREKYDVIDGTTDTAIAIGYSENVVGFGWTNAVYRIFEGLLR